MELHSTTEVVGQLRQIVGRRHVITEQSKAQRFSAGYRCGGGAVAAVVRPGSLIEQWRVFRACIRADYIVIVQAANTGLTGGSTPFGSYDRPVVIINTLRIRRIHLLREGQQAVCLAGATLHELERVLAPLGREPHSVIGSSCIGASVIGGICNNSGGALVRRGPAYTEYALYAKVDESGEIHLRNHLGIRLGDQAEDILERVERGSFSDRDVMMDHRHASAAIYARRVRDVHASSAARFNADPCHLFEASGSAGKVMVFAVRVDTFPKDQLTTTFYIGTNDPGELTTLRRRILTEQPVLPVAGEYIHREAFDLAAIYGKDIFLAIERLGTQRLPILYAAKSRIDTFARLIGLSRANVSDRLLQLASRWFSNHLPARMLAFRDRFEHHLILKMADDGIEPARSLLSEMFPSAGGDVFECTREEETKAFLHRFAVAGAAVRYRAIHHAEVEDILALDIALRRNDEDWFERLPADVAAPIAKAIYYGHFFCHVFHQDYVLRKGAASLELKHRLLELIDGRGAQYPAEHNVGHLYPATAALQAHYRELDPGNRLNPGIGQTSRERSWESHGP
ncbi:D-lactate dehydrogenase [Steroidobacter flavus]|uniref:Quinone-dependent D-lactate dehydrogenase n=1 Tax=Steroidobacter flavus TaxID=1842136 RepID=A0ABV8SZH7_9GAMM